MIRIIPIFFLALLFSQPMDAQGWVWGRGSVGNNVTSWPVATDPSGNVFVAGVASGAVSFDNFGLPFTDSGNMCVVAKYDQYGDFLWSRSTQTGANAFLTNITTDLNGNCYLLGWIMDSSLQIGTLTIHNTAYPNSQYFIAKFNSSGDVIWTNNGGGRNGTDTAPAVTFSSAYAAGMQGLGAVATDAGGNLYVTTCFNLPKVTVGTDTFTNKNATATSDDILLVKYDAMGNIVWAKSAGGDGSDIPFGLTVTPAGDIYIAGMFNSDSITFGPSIVNDTSAGLQQWNGFIARYSVAGNPVWASGSNGAGNVFASGVTSDASNNVYITGGTSDNVISFGGTTITDPTPGIPILYLIKYDSSNTINWYKTIGSPTGGAAWGYGIAMSPTGYVWVGGALSNEVSINGQILDTPGKSIDPVFIAGFDSYGNYIASGALQSGSTHQAGIACDPFGAVYLCSDYKYPCAPFIIANDVLANVPQNESWLYLAKYNFEGGGSGSGGSSPSTIYVRTDTAMCSIDNIILNAPPGYTLYSWNDGSSDTILPVTAGGTYWVKGLGNTNVAIIDTIVVTADSSLCNCNVILPNAFTPNGDGRNDTYGPVFASGCAISKYAFSIYNRWGQRVFYTENPYAQWDGTFNGAAADMDVYMFYLIYQPNPNYPQHVKKGDVTLIR